VLTISRKEERDLRHSLLLLLNAIHVHLSERWGREVEECRMRQVSLEKSRGILIFASRGLVFLQQQARLQYSTRCMICSKSTICSLPQFLNQISMFRFHFPRKHTSQPINSFNQSPFIPFHFDPFFLERRVNPE